MAWKKCTTGGTTYYHNEETDETEWGRPEGYTSEDEGAHTTGADTDDEAFAEFAEFNMDHGLLFELQSLDLFTRLNPREPLDLSDEAVSSDAAAKIAFVNEKLQEGAGSDEDWVQAMSTNNFALAEYLLHFLESSANHALSLSASQCLAFAGNLYPKLWADYTQDEAHAHLGSLLRSAIHLVFRLSALSQVADEHAPSAEPYMGFDERDVAEFNLQGYDEHVNAGSAESGAEAVEERGLTVLTYLLLLFQFFSKEVTVMKYSVDASAVEVNTLGELAVTAVCQLSLDEVHKELKGALDSPQEQISRLEKLLVRSLVAIYPNFDEDAYLLTLKVVAALNRQAPFVEALNSTEVAKMCTSLQVQSGSAANISQGLMHLLNDIGTPAHTLPEAVPVLLFYISLLKLTESEEGFFYTNDMQIITDVVIRELFNIPFECDNEAELMVLEELRVNYMNIAAAMNTHEAWRGYKNDELREALQFVVTSSESCAEWDSEMFCWSRDTAQEMLESA